MKVKANDIFPKVTSITSRALEKESPKSSENCFPQPEMLQLQPASPPNCLSVFCVSIFNLAWQAAGQGQDWIFHVTHFLKMCSSATFEGAEGLCVNVQRGFAASFHLNASQACVTALQQHDRNIYTNMATPCIALHENFWLLADV